MQHRSNKCSHRPHCRGAVMVMALLAIVLLAALVFYVFNTGRHVQSRVVLQNAADASAAAGAGWVARSLNTIAMNNVETSRLIAAVNTLDAMPKATAFTLADQKVMADAVRSQLQRGVKDSWVRDELQRFLDEVEEEIQILEPIDQLLNHSGYDLRHMTHYEAPDGRGDMWLAMESLENQSLATMENLPLLAQTAAVDGAEVNLPDDRVHVVGLMLPLWPQIPFRHGVFDDFERPVKEGLLPNIIDHIITNRGPYDAVFGWRYPIYETIGGDGGVGGSSGGSPIGLPGGGGGGPPVIRTQVAYGVWGTQSWLSRLIQSMARTDLQHSRFPTHVGGMAWIKLEYLWPGTDLREVIEPDWRIDFARANTIGAANPQSIHETAFVAVEIKSRYPLGDPQFLSAGSWAYVTHYNRYMGYWTQGARPIWVGRWEDPRKWRGVPRVSRYIWRDQWEYLEDSDPEIGIASETDEDGATILQTIYRIDDFMFVGVNVGEPVEVRNPHNFANKSELPGPINFDSDAIKRTDADKEKYLTFLGVAQRSGRSILAPGRFDDPESDNNMVAIAQAHVFNNHSWDLWTQMWHAQLEPTQQYSRWVDLLEQDLADAALTPAVNVTALPNLLTYMQSIEPLAQKMLRH